MRPRAIKRFEVSFLLYLAFSILFTAATWEPRMDAYYATPGTEQMPAHLPLYLMVGTYLVDLILWFCIARLGLAAAKWIYIVVFAAGVIITTLTLVVGQAPDTAVLMVSAGSLALKAVSIYFLLQPEVGDWFVRRT